MDFRQSSGRIQELSNPGSWEDCCGPVGEACGTIGIQTLFWTVGKCSRRQGLNHSATVQLIHVCQRLGAAGAGIKIASTASLDYWRAMQREQ